MTGTIGAEAAATEAAGSPCNRDYVVQSKEKKQRPLFLRGPGNDRVLHSTLRQRSHMSNTKDPNNTIEFLASVLENYGTAQVLNCPSDEDRKEVLDAVNSIDLEPVVRDLATLAVSAVANTLHAMALRPADYANMTDLPKSIVSQMAKVLESESGRRLFAETFHAKLKSRG